MNGMGPASRYEQQVRGVLAAAEAYSSAAYSWFGRPISALAKATAKAMAAQTARVYLLHTLQQQLYVDFYCRGGTAASSDAVSSATRAMLHRTPFVRALSAANTGRGSWEDGWRIRAIEDQWIVVEQNGLNLWVVPREVCTLGGSTPTIGSSAVVRVPKELLNLSPGFYVALGDEPLPSRGQEPLIRFYWNLVSEAAPRFLEDATARLNLAHIAFRLKVVNEPGRYTRCDSGVLSVPRCRYHEVTALMLEVYERLSDRLRPQVPAFTKQLAPGLGLAEEPGNGGSFGLHRCRLLADGIILAHELALQSLDDRLRVVATRFEEEGISLNAPFLNPNSFDQYAPLAVGCSGGEST